MARLDEGGTVTAPPPPPTQYKIGDIIQQYPDGTALIVTGFNAYGDPTTSLSNISPGGGSTAVHDAPTVNIGQPYQTTLPDGSVATVQDTNYGPHVISTNAPKDQTIYGGTPPAGYNYAYDSQGRPIQLVAQPQPGAGTPTGDPRVVSLGGGRSALVQDSTAGPQYLSTWADSEVTGDTFKVDLGGGRTALMQQSSTGPKFISTYESPINYSGTKNLGGGFTGLVDESGKVVSAAVSPDYYSPEHLKYLNDSLAADTAAKKQQLAQQQAQASMEHGDRLAAIQADIQRTKMSIASNEKIATMQDKTEKAKAILASGVTQRGQNIDYGLGVRGQNITMRGQDITNLGNTTQAVGTYYDTAARQQDPIRQSILLAGGSGGTTPVELASDTYRNYITQLVANTPKIGTVAAAPPLPPEVKYQAAEGADVMRFGDGKNVSLKPGKKLDIRFNEKGTETLKVRVNDQGEPVIEGIVPHGEADVGAATGATTTTLRTYTWPDGTKHNTPYYDPAKSSATAAAAAVDRYAQAATAAGQTRTGASTDLTNAYAALDALTPSTLLARYNLIRRGDAYFYNRTNTAATPAQLQAIAAREKPAPAAVPQQAAPPATQPAPPPPLYGDDALVGGMFGQPSNEAGLAAARATITNLIRDVVGGGAQPVADLKLAPVYGQNIGNPQDYAASYDRYDAPTQDLIHGLFNLRGVTPEVFDKRRVAYKPVALSPGFQPAYG